MPPKYAPCEVLLEFGDGEYLFRLGLKQIAELQEKCGSGLGVIFARVIRGRIEISPSKTLGVPTHGEWKYEDLRETIRLGLIGGGAGTVADREVKVTAMLAKTLVERYIDDIPKREAWTIAAAILTACIEGYTPSDDTAEDEEEPGKDVATVESGSTTPSP
jgi:hypothetical protein